MTTIISTTKLHHDLVIEALINHGFEVKRNTYKKYGFFGRAIYKVRVDFVPKLHFLEYLLHIAEIQEDYISAFGIKKMIDIKKGED